MASYASGSDVPVNRSRGHLEALLTTHGAAGFAYGWTAEQDRVEFVMHARRIRFTLPRPKRDKFVWTEHKRLRSDSQVQAALEQEDRRRWRALLLVVRAKIEAVEGGIATFDEEFLAFMVMPNDRTVGEILLPQLADGTISRKLLPAGERPQ